MIDLTKHLFTAEIKRRFLGEEEEAAVPFDGFCSHVFELGPAHTREILKISHSSRVSLAELGTELSFTRHLAEAGVSICAPLTSPETIIRVSDGAGGEFYGYRYRKVAGEDFGEAEKTEANLREAGRILASFHRAAVSFQSETAVRADFLSREFVNYKKYVPEEESGVHARFDGLVGALKKLPKSKSSYGLCHGDSHDGNFLLSKEGGLHLIDFDDVELGFFVNDLAILVDACLDLKGDVAAQGERVFSQVYRGYKEVRELSAEELSWIPLFVRHRWLMQHTLSALLEAASEPLAEKQLASKARRIAMIEADFPIYESFFRLDFPALAKKI